MDGVRLVEAVRRPDVVRVAAPVAFLLAVTIAVLLVRSAFTSGGGESRPSVRRAAPAAAPPATGPARTAATPAARRPPRTTRAAAADAAYVTVQNGDTFSSIAARNGTTVAEIERLNPGVSSNALSIGQRIRVR